MSMQKINGGIEELRQALAEIGPICYRENGCRSTSADEFLPVALHASKKIGITRIGQISELIETQIGYPVTQCTRPNILDHANLGVNTGSQGKGTNLNQAMISCIMESVEAYSAENYNSPLIRGSFNQVSKSNVAIDPAFFFQSPGTDPILPDEPILWTQALCPDLEQNVLVPFVSAAFPAKFKDFQTRAPFPQGSNGLATRTSYLNATIHALYEIIERRLRVNIETGRKTTLLKIDASAIPDFENPFLTVLKNFKVNIFLVLASDLPKIPMIIASIETPLGCSYGSGCCFNFEIAIHRALSEAFQANAIQISGSREDLMKGTLTSELVELVMGFSRPDFEGNRKYLLKFPAISSLNYQQVTFSEAKRSSGACEFYTLQDEYQLLREWIKNSGYNTFFICNLSHRALNIPVVKVIIPQMAQPTACYIIPRMSREHVLHYRYRNAFSINSKE